MSPDVKLFASCVIRRHDEVLVTREKDDEGKTKYNLPGGHVETGETPMEAAVREVREETGLSVEVGRFLQLTVNVWSKSDSVLLYFEGDVVGEANLVPEEGLELKWMTRSQVEEVADSDFVFGSKEAVLKAFDGSVSEVGGLLVRKFGERI